MARRIHVPLLHLGDIPLDPAQAHHARHVLRLANECVVEVFDDAGACAPALLIHVGPRDAAVRVTRVNTAAGSFSLQWTVASAVPKGDRADWLVEKLSELGASAFTPLATARSVVLPEGRSKHERWVRIATEAAKQSRRAGVMRIDELTPLSAALQRVKSAGLNVQQENEIATPQTALPHIGWFLTTEVPAIPIADAIVAARKPGALTLFVGPEGGWTAAEISAFDSAGMTPVRLGATILRVETAAIAAGAVVACLLAS